MATDGHKTALELALAAFEEVQTERRLVQGELFAEPAENAKNPVQVVNGSRGAGRPPGARNRRTDELARWYIAQNDGRDPLERGIEIAGLPVLAKGVLEGLAERLGCSRHEAAKFWAGVLATTLPFVHQRLSQLEVKPPGTPGSGEPVVWTFADDGQLIDVSEPPEPFDKSSGG